jgi:glycine cleavage system H protein
MNIPEDLRYARTHEWVRLKGGTAYVGITDYAQDALGDIVYVEAPQPDLDVRQGEEVATVESVKAASAIYAPLSGRIREVNPDLETRPELLNQKPYEAYIFTLTPADPAEMDSLLDAAGYRDLLEQEKKDH